MPKITIVHYAAPPTIGGVEATIEAHARLFVEHGYDCQVVAGGGEGFDSRIPLRILANAGTKSPRVLETNAELAKGTVGERFSAVVAELSAQLSDVIPTGPDSVVIVHNALSLHKNLALTAALFRLHQLDTFRLIAWCHDFAWADPQYSGDVHPGYPWDLLRNPWPNVDYVVVSKARRQELIALWASRQGEQPPVRVVPPGIDPCEFLGIEPRTAQWVKQFGLLDATPLLLLPARLTRRKRIEFAIDVVRELGNLTQGAKLVVTGPPGPHNPANAAYLKELEQRSAGIESSIILLHKSGAVSRSVMRDLYLLSDALVFPSEREGFGIPLLEAGLTRLPIFCTDIAPFREIAGDQVQYIPPNMPAAAAAALIARTLEQNSTYNLKRRVIDQFSWESVFRERIEPLVR